MDSRHLVDQKQNALNFGFIRGKALSNDEK